MKVYVGDDSDTFIFFRAEYQLLFDAADEAEGALDDRRRLSLSTRMARRHSDTGGSGITRGSSGRA